MARYKPYELRQAKMIPLSYADQVVPGSFEYALNEIVEEPLDMSVFEKRYCNDQTGATAYDPKVLLKIVLYGYYKGILSSRKLEEACRRNVVFMALSADTRPHFTTIAGFVADLENEIVDLFRDVLVYCDAEGLIGREHFAVDGCRLTSNASKEWSGTHEELLKKQKKMEKRAREIVRRHRERDKREEEQEGLRAEEDEKRLEKFHARIRRIKEFLRTADKKVGISGEETKTNVTDPESAKMTTSHGVMQGYNGVAVVDGKHQVIVHAEARGEVAEQHLLKPMIEATRRNFEAITPEGKEVQDVFAEAVLTADSGFHSARSMEYIEDESRVDAYVADKEMRRRDEAFSETDRYRQRRRKERRASSGYKERKRFGPEEFDYDENKQTCTCPAGQRLYRSGANLNKRGRKGVKFTAPKSACGPCPLRARCLRHPDRTEHRQVVFFKGQHERAEERPMDRMRRKIDSPEGRRIYAKRMGTAEPPFGNLRNKGMNRFTLRGQRKVNAQWNMYALVHNIEKIAHYGAIAA